MVNDGNTTKKSGKKKKRRVKGESKKARPTSSSRSSKHTSRRRRRGNESSSRRRGSGGDSNGQRRSRPADNVTPRSPHDTELSETAAAMTANNNASQDVISPLKTRSTPRRSKEAPGAYSPSRSSRFSREEQMAAHGATNSGRRNNDLLRMVPAIETRKVQAYAVPEIHNSAIRLAESNKKKYKTNGRKKTESTTAPTTENDRRNSEVGWLLSIMIFVLIVGGVVVYFATKWSDSIVPAALEPTFSLSSTSLQTSRPSTSPPSSSLPLITVSPTLNPTTRQPTLLPTLAPTIHPTTKDPTPSPIPGISHFQPLDRPIRVACVGDSLTLGTFGGLPINDTYPFQLQQMLGESFEVYNFGRNSVTALRGLSVSYVDTAHFQASLNVEPDIYLLMLGHNDAKYWEVHGQEYGGDMAWIVNMVQSISAVSPPRIIMAIPPWVKTDAYGIQNDILVSSVQPAIETLAALEDLQLVNMYDVTYNQGDSYLGDGLHPNKKGYGSLAAAWKVAILCNQNDICEAGENCLTCPQDCHMFCPPS